jgi:pyruvate kinase
MRRGDQIGAAAIQDEEGRVVEPASVSCAVDEVFSAVAPGHRILVDDGTIEAVVETVADDHFDVVILRPPSAKLKAAKGINLPDSDLQIGGLTADDRTALAEVAPLADLVAMSFVRGVDDVFALQRELDELGCSETAVVLKIEHAAAFRALPRMLLQGLRRPPLAVMVARGDLAVEVGFERLAELQEEILWLCEAAHIPVIWATQVLESLAKDGMPTRAEVTDAAWASRAECVMLNKGPHIVSAMRFLDDVFARMHEHQDKRTPMLRRLSVSTAFGDLQELDVS